MEVGESEKRGKSEIFAGRNGTSQKVNFPKQYFTIKILGAYFSYDLEQKVGAFHS